MSKTATAHPGEADFSSGTWQGLGSNTAETKSIRSIGHPALHRLISVLPLGLRYLAWHVFSGGLFNQAGLREHATRAAANFAASPVFNPTAEEVTRFRQGYEQEVRNNFCLLLAIAPKLHQPVRSSFFRVEGLESLRRRMADGPILFLGSHLSAYHSAAVAIAAAGLRSIHLTTVMPHRTTFQERWSHLYELGKRYVDEAIGNPIPAIIVPDPKATMHLLRALRRREPIWFAVDTDVGISASTAICEFLGQPVAVPTTLYEMALRENAVFFQMDVERTGDVDRPLTHRFHVRIRHDPGPASGELKAYHQRLLDLVAERVRRNPASWTIWRYWERQPSIEKGALPRASGMQRRGVHAEGATHARRET